MKSHIYSTRSPLYEVRQFKASFCPEPRGEWKIGGRLNDQEPYRNEMFHHARSGPPDRNRGCKRTRLRPTVNLRPKGSERIAPNAPALGTGRYRLPRRKEAEAGESPPGPTNPASIALPRAGDWFPPAPTRRRRVHDPLRPRSAPGTRPAASDAQSSSAGARPRAVGEMNGPFCPGRGVAATAKPRARCSFRGQAPAAMPPGGCWGNEPVSRDGSWLEPRNQGETFC